MTRPGASALFTGDNFDAGGRQCETHWFCIPLDPDVSNVITRRVRSVDQTVRRIGGWTTKLLRG